MRPAVDLAHHLLAGTEEAAHHRSLANPQGSSCLLVGEAGDVDRDEDVPEVVRQRSDDGIQLTGLERCVRLRGPGIGDEIHLVGERLGTEPAAPGSALVEEGVAQRPQEVAEVVFVAEEPRPREHARVRLLDEVFRILAGAGKRPRGAVEPVEVVSEPFGVERGCHRYRADLSQLTDGDR